MTYAVMAWAGGEGPAIAVAVCATREDAEQERDVRSPRYPAWRFYVATVTREDM